MNTFRDEHISHILEQLDEDAVRLEILKTLETGTSAFYPGKYPKVVLEVQQAYTIWLLLKFGGSMRGKKYISGSSELLRWLIGDRKLPVQQWMAEGKSIKIKRGSQHILQMLRGKGGEKSE